MSNTSIITLFNQWHEYRRNAWKTTPDTNTLIAGLAEIEDKIAGQVPNNKQEAFIQVTFLRGIWLESLDYHPLEGRHLIMDTSFRSSLQYLKEREG